MTGPAGSDLLGGKAEAGQAAGIVVCLDVAGKHCDPRLRSKVLQGPLQQRGLAGAGRADEIHAQHVMPAKALAQFVRDALVLA